MVAIDSINITKTNKLAAPSFGGHDLRSNDFGEKIYKFYLPKVAYDDAALHYRKFVLDNNDNIIFDETSAEEVVKFDNNNPVLELNPKDIKLAKNEILGYRFVIDGKDYNDRYRFTIYDGKRYNISTPLSSDVLQTPNSIYHLLPNNFNPKLGNKDNYEPAVVTVTNALGEEVNVNAKTAVMNHFMRFDASLQDIIAKIPHIKSMGFRRILSTPIFGQDNLSTHGYWSSNPFQITETLGHMEDFEKLQIELFKNSMGFIADGAFTDEGLSGIHFRDVLRHGENSPFANWFELHNFPLKKIGLGVLSDKEMAEENMDIRVVNSPVIWTVNTEGKPTGNFGRPNPNYNPKRETFIQIYDKRLVSQRQLEEDKIFYSYDIKNVDKRDEISNWMDSVLPYAFPVDPKEVVRKAKYAKSIDAVAVSPAEEFVPAKEFLKHWEHFELTNAHGSNGVTLWTGNKDIAKLRFTVPATKQMKVFQEAVSGQAGEAKVKELLNASEQVKNYINKVGAFWTNKTAKTLRLYIAKQLEGAKTSDEFLSAISSKTNNALPVEMKYITRVQIENVLNDKFIPDRETYRPALVQQLFKEYPPEALEVDPYISSLLAHPKFQENMQNKLYTGPMKNVAVKILGLVDKNNDNQSLLLNAEGRLNPKTALITQLIADDITKYLLIKGLSADFDTDKIFNANKKTYYADLKDMQLDAVLMRFKTPEEKVDYLLRIMSSNIANIPNSEIIKVAKYLSEKIKNITPEQIKVANLIIDKTEAGLNWRIDAAKDIAEIENFVEGEVSTPESWQEVLNFWKSFNNGVKRFNRHAYQIGEFTNTDIGYSKSNEAFTNSGSLEQRFIDEGGFTTQSNYNYLYSLLPAIYSGFPEANDGNHKEAFGDISSKMIFGWDGTPGYLYSASKNNLTKSHVAVGNHDKPRITHTFAMNMPLAYKPYTEWKDLTNGIKDDLLSCALQHTSFFTNIQLQKFDEVFKVISQKNLAKLAALAESFNEVLYHSNNIPDLPNKPDGSASDIQDIVGTFVRAGEKLAKIGSPAERMFFYRPFEVNYSDIVDLVAETNPEYADFMKRVKPEFHRFLTRFASIRGKELTKLMVALPGAPTLYAGDELLETGGEEKSRNPYLQNRNLINWDKLDGTDYSHVVSYLDDISRIFNLRKDSDLTSLNNGETTLLRKQGENENKRVLGFYRYNENDDAIILVHNKGFNASRKLPENEGARKETLPFIDMSEGEITENNSLNKIYEKQVGIPSKLPEGTKYVNALDSTQKFVVGKDGNIYPLEADRIVLNDSVTILKRLQEELK